RELVANLEREFEIASFARAPVEQTEGVNGREVHLGAAGVHELGSFELSAEQIPNPPRTREGLRIARLLVPEQQAEHDVVMAPCIPGLAALGADVRCAPVQPALLRPG